MKIYNYFNNLIFYPTLRLLNLVNEFTKEMFLMVFQQGKGLNSIQIRVYILVNTLTGSSMVKASSCFKIRMYI